MPLIEKTKRDRIRDLNNAFRKNFDATLGRTMLTVGVTSLPNDVRVIAIRKTVTFDHFAFEAQTILWKIDYYDLDLVWHSADPADPAVTKRVLTVMLFGEC